MSANLDRRMRKIEGRHPRDVDVRKLSDTQLARMIVGDANADPQVVLAALDSVIGDMPIADWPSMTDEDAWRIVEVVRRKLQ
jgi:hypothetical protein